jgi:hypothetical protein
MAFRSALVRVLVAGCGVAAAAVAIGIGCSNYAEGERCDRDSYNFGNDDCQDGLVCTEASKLGTNSDRCCPPDLNNAKPDSVCAKRSNPITPPSQEGGPGPTADGGDGGDGAADGGDAQASDASDAGDAAQASDAPEGG